MTVLQKRSLRSQRALEWRLLALLLILIVAVVIVINYKLKLKSEQSEQYDYFYFAHESLELFGENESSERVVQRNPVVVKAKHDAGLLLPVVFIGGYAKSGSKIVKEVIEHYANVTCNNETRVITQFLAMADKWNQSQFEVTRLNEAGIDEELRSEILGVFTREIVYGQNVNPQTMICVHEGDAFKYTKLLSEFFLAAKLVFVVRDGRPVVHDIMQELPPVLRRNTSYVDKFLDWSKGMHALIKGCDELGDEKCFLLRYEDLFVSGWENIDYLFDFLGMMHKLPVDRPKQAIQPSSTVFDYLAHRQPLEEELLRQSVVVESLLETLGYDPKLYVAGFTTQDFET